MTENIISRASILIQQRRYAEAEKLLKDLLSSNPDNVQILTLLAEVNLQQDNLENAENLINTAIGLDPEFGYLFYIKARVDIQKDKYNEAEKNLKLALELDPANGDYYALWASVKLTRKQYEGALEHANKALELDAENILGLNVRSSALLKLDRKEDAFITIEGALREDPNNAYTHANYGWNLLEKGDSKKALVHFGEALKNDPSSGYAQAGMVEALKANNFVYKAFLKYTFWISNLTAKYQWGVILGFYFGVKFLRSIADNNATLRPFLLPVVIVLTIIAFSTWIITPFSNLFLRFNKFGKHLLNSKQMLSSNFVAASFVIFLLGGLGYLLANDEKFLTIAVFGFAMMVPLSTMFSPTKYKHSLVIYAGLMALIGLGAIFITFQTGEMVNSITTLFIFGFIAFQFVANFLLIKQSNY
ncbi:MAG: Tetratricopeptide 2 repeat-containing protein [Sphingobacteriales bacterium]|nr:Tetratricopeptide 2 repeat-containing protein [Sphingobacteriales bacterium]